MGRGAERRKGGMKIEEQRERMERRERKKEESLRQR